MTRACKRSRPRQGMTLTEMLLASSLFLLALILCGELAVTGMRTHTLGSDKNQLFRTTSVALDRLNRELLACSRIYAPTSLTVGGTVTPGEGAGPLVFRTLSSRNAQGAQVVGYRWDKSAKTLTRMLFQLTYDPAVPSSWVELTEDRKTMATQITDFSLTLQDPARYYGSELLDTCLQVTPDRQQPLELICRTRVRGL